MQKWSWYTKEDADRYVRKTLRAKVTALRDVASKFIEGVTRMDLRCQLMDSEFVMKFNTILKLISTPEYKDKFDTNLNDMSAYDLYLMFRKKVNEIIKCERLEMDNMTFDRSERMYDYKIVKIDSFEEASAYSGYTNPDSRWCITCRESNFDNYTKEGINQVYFCLADGFEDIRPIAGEGCPRDAYGLSMISIIVDPQGNLVYCTSRWNHLNGGNDRIYDTPMEVSKVIGVHFYNTFKPKTDFKDKINTLLSRFASGEDPKEVFEDCTEASEGMIGVKINGKWNYVNSDYEIVSKDEWFDICYKFEGGFGIVRSGLAGYHYVDKNGEPICKQLFDTCFPFREGFGMVMVYQKGYNFVNQNGDLISPDFWFDNCYYFNNGFSQVRKNGKYNFIGVDGKVLYGDTGSTDNWFVDAIGFTSDGFSGVKLNKEDPDYMYLSKNGELLTRKQYYDLIFYNKGSVQESVRESIMEFLNIYL